MNTRGYLHVCNLAFLTLIFLVNGVPVKSNSRDAYSSLGQQNIVRRGKVPLSDAAVNTSNAEEGSTMSSRSKATEVSSVANLVEVYEHEFFDSERQMWVGGCAQNSTQRWTSSPTNKGRYQKLPPPPQLLAPKGYQYTSEWKIDVTGSSNIRDELGWEYFIDHEGAGADMGMANARHGSGRRRRRWLRSVDGIQGIEIAHETTNSTTTAVRKRKPNNFDYFLSMTKKEFTVVKKYIDEKIWKELLDAFNFKGYGIAFQKSMLHQKACAVIWRLPLTVHFDFFETRPWLPLLTSTCALYFPFTGSFSLNASLPVALFKHAILILLDQTRFLLTFAWYVLSKIIVFDILGALILSNIIKGLGFGSRKENDNHDDEFNIQGSVARKKKSDHLFSERWPALPMKRELQYSSRISERVGLSMTWKYNKSKGVEFKFGWWHCFLPTIDYIEEISSTIVNQQNIKQKNNANSNIPILKDWLHQKVGKLGVVWGQQMVPSPVFSCNTVLSLSGFYFQGKPLKTLYSIPNKTLAMMNKITRTEVEGKKTKLVLKEREKHLQHIIESDSEDETEIVEVKVSAT